MDKPRDSLDSLKDDLEEQVRFELALELDEDGPTLDPESFDFDLEENELDEASIDQGDVVVEEPQKFTGWITKEDLIQEILRLDPSSAVSHSWYKVELVSELGRLGGALAAFNVCVDGEWRNTKSSADELRAALKALDHTLNLLPQLYNAWELEPAQAMRERLRDLLERRPREEEEVWELELDLSEEEELEGPPYPLLDGPETVWVIDKPSRIRQTRYETREAAIQAMKRREP